MGHPFKINIKITPKQYSIFPVFYRQEAIYMKSYNGIYQYIYGSQLYVHDTRYNKYHNK